MKLTSRTTPLLIIGFIWCIFMGITVISIGIGSLYPQLNVIAGPFVCPYSQVQVESQPYQVSPVESGYTLTYYCVDNRTGSKTELDFWPKHLYAGSVYGLALFILILTIWRLYSRWNASVDAETSEKWTKWIATAIVVVFVVGCTLFNLMPLFRSTLAKPAVPTPEARATALEATFQALTSGGPSAFDSAATPAPDWKGIPIMIEATAGQQVNDNTYTFDIVVDTGRIESFYSNTLESQGWSLDESRWLGMKFKKDNSTLLVALAPAADEQSWVVTLVLLP